MCAVIHVRSREKNYVNVSILLFSKFVNFFQKNKYNIMFFTEKIYNFEVFESYMKSPKKCKNTAWHDNIYYFVERQKM